MQETFCKAANVVVVIVERRLHYSSASDISIQLCTFVLDLSSNSEAGNSLRNCGFGFSSCSFPLYVFMAYPSHAIRNLVNTGVSGRRRSIDMVSSEYANFAPQSQHTR